MSNVGARTSARRGPARSGRPPRETMAATSASGSAAAHSAAPAPVLAPNQPMLRPRAHGWSRSQAVTWVSRPASSSMSNTLARSASSSGVSRSNSSVPRPASLSTEATYRLRGLCRLLPLPCTNTTMPGAFSGNATCPGSASAPARIEHLLVPAGPRVERLRLRVHRAGQQVAHVLVGGRVEVVVPLAD